MRRAVLILAVSSAFTGPCFPIGRGALTSRQQRGICLQMTDNLDKTDVDVFLTPSSEVYSFHFFHFSFLLIWQCLFKGTCCAISSTTFLSPYQAQQSNDGMGQVIDAVQATDSDSAGAIDSAMKPLEAGSRTKVKKEWIDRPKGAGKFPTNLLAQKAGGFTGVGWAKSNPQVKISFLTLIVFKIRLTHTAHIFCVHSVMQAVSEMKGPAKWIAISLCFALQFSITGTYSMDGGVPSEKSYPILRGTPLSMSKGSAGETVKCREVYGLPCFPSGNKEAFLGF